MKQRIFVPVIVLMLGLIAAVVFIAREHRDLRTRFDDLQADHGALKATFERAVADGVGAAVADTRAELVQGLAQLDERRTKLDQLLADAERVRDQAQPARQQPQGSAAADRRRPLHHGELSEGDRQGV